MRRFAKSVVLCAVLCFIGAQCFYGFIFILSHLPPSLVHLDGVLRIFGTLARFLTWPRRIMRALWPGEMTPTALNYTLALLNWLVWGTMLAALRTLRSPRVR